MHIGLLGHDYAVQVALGISIFYYVHLLLVPGKEKEKAGALNIYNVGPVMIFQELEYSTEA